VRLEVHEHQPGNEPVQRAAGRHYCGNHGPHHGGNDDHEAAEQRWSLVLIDVSNPVTDARRGDGGAELSTKGASGSWG
jgi:hypothetical protein